MTQIPCDAVPRRQAAVLGDEHKGGVWVNRAGEIWAWVQDDWRMLRNSGLWSGISLYCGERMMRAAGPFTEIDFVRLFEPRKPPPPRPCPDCGAILIRSYCEAPGCGYPHK